MAELALADLAYYDEKYHDLEDAFTRRQRKGKKRKEAVNKNHLSLSRIRPRTKNQGKAFDYFYEGYNLLLHGVAGTGKTFVALYLAFDELFNGDGRTQKVAIVRSVVPTREMGFLPGKEKEKMQVYEAPYHNICTELFGRGDAWELLKQKGMVEFISTSHIRGTTMDNTLIVVDECQNMNFHELDTVITRVGENSSILFSGDYQQTDLDKPWDQSGLDKFMKILGGIDSFKTVDFQFEDIVRSGLVKDYIVAKTRLENNEIHTRTVPGYKRA